MRVLAINPWIVDFAAYDFWLKPYGFLVILQFLMERGIEVDFIDCLDKKKNRDNFGRGKYFSFVIEKPAVLKNIPRYFKCYGIDEEIFREKIKNKKPDIILITSSMTYWYQGVEKVARIVKEYFPEKPIVLGGTYPTLLPRHAKENIPSDYNFSNLEIRKFFKSIFNITFDPLKFYNTLPIYENFYHSIDYVVLRTTWGCPFNCSYCAIRSLQKGFYEVSSQKVSDYILNYHTYKGIKDFVFYDDALFYRKDHAKNVLRNIVKSRIHVRFHTPNALHIRFLDKELAYLIKKAGFINPHFGLETLNEKLQKTWQNKVNKEDLLRGISLLKEAGFKNGEFCFYLLLGYPNQDLKELRKDIETLHSEGARISLAEFSPTPKTKIFNNYRSILKNPLLHNNSIFTFFPHSKLKEFWDIKNYVRQLNKRWEDITS